jgi:uncharacterized protein (DUF1015 family)
MAQIQPFRAIRPNSLYADQLVFTAPQVESVSGDYTKEGSLAPLKTLLETGARQRPETPAGHIQACRDICETLSNLIEKDQLWQEPTPGIYVYEVVHKTYRQTGIWALTSIDDYSQGNIKIHELTFGDSVRRIRNYRERTGLEGSPVLLAYPPDITINRIIAETRANGKKVTLGNQQGLHRLWKIENEQIQHQLIEAFANIPTVYLADGHHRLESAAMLVEDQQHAGAPAFDMITSLYMATDQLRIQEYDRVVIPKQQVDKTDLMRQLCMHFDVRKSPENKPVQPRELHRMGMYLGGNWYQLAAKTHTYINKGAAENIDAAILQEQVLGPIFDIIDPKTDPSLKCAGGEKAMEEMDIIIESNPNAIAFTLCPLTVDQLIAVADAGEILPPKSTWIDPKVPYGLLLHRHF